MGGPSDETVNSQKDLSQQQIDLAKTQDNRSNELFTMTKPGLQTAIDHYAKLASGDPNTAFTAIAPQAEAIAASSDAAKKNIVDNVPRGGTQDLALQQTDLAKSGQTGKLIVDSYNSAFPALANLAGQGMGLSINEAANSIAAFQGAGQTLGNIGSQESEGKAATMGMIGALGGGLGTLGGGIACWIAEALYGESDPRVDMLRHWLKQWKKRSVIGRAVVWLYTKIGQRIAKLVRYKAVDRLLRPLFDWGVRTADEEFWAPVRACRSAGV